ncbi:MAG: Ig-like domain-containing protein, partial [Bradyrhizobium sp.]|uniref:VCBS domain-containing protein n=1 Tax=Bradyrhizobium sp. TaxID=376 RepID=UPI00272FE98B
QGLDTGESKVITFDYVANDGEANSAPATVTITVNGVNDAPTITSPNNGNVTALNFLENSTANVVDVDATDVDAGQTLTYSLSGADQTRFNISASGVVTFISAPDYETRLDADADNIYNFTVTVTDNGTGNLTDTQSFAITIEDVGEAPPDTQGPTGLTFDINAAILGTFESGNSLPDNTIIGTFTATGDPNSTTFTYSITDTDASHIITNFLSLNASTGELSTLNTLETGVPAGTYTFNITATDQAGNSGSPIPVMLFVGTTGGDGSVATPITLTVGPDIAFGFNGNDVIDGSGGDDTIIAGQNADTIRGNAGDDFLYGGDNDDDIAGGAGSDTLTGGGGKDSFRFYSSTEGTDTILDFTSGGGGADRILLDDAGFGDIGLTLTAAEFVSGAGTTAATTAAQRLIYNTSTGALYFDADGSASGSTAVQIAVVVGQPALTLSDFQMF